MSSTNLGYRNFICHELGLKATFVRIGVAFFLSLTCVTYSNAQKLEPQLEHWESEIDALESDLAEAGLDEDGAALIINNANDLKSEVNNCISAQENQIEQLQSDLSILGATPIEPEAGESTDNGGGEAAPDGPDINESDQVDTPTEEIQVVSEDLLLVRMGIENDITQAKIIVQECRFLILRIDKVIRSASKQQQTLSAARLSSQSGRLMVSLADNIKNPGLTLVLALEKVVGDQKRTRLTSKRVVKLLIIVLTGAILGWYIGRIILKWSTHQRGRGGEATFSTVVARHFHHFIPHLLATGLGTATLSLYSQPDPLDSIIYRLLFGLFLLTIALMINRWLTGPISPGSNFIHSPELPAVLNRRMTWFTCTVLAGFVVFGTDALTTSTEPALYPLRALLVLLITSTLIHLVNAAKLIQAMRGKLVPLRILLILASLSAVIADFGGYRNLANHLISALLVTVVAGLILWTLLWLFKTLLHGLVHGTSSASYQVRSWLGMRPSEKRAEFGWLRLILNFLLWISFIGVLVSAWDPTDNVLSKIGAQISHGIPIGQDKTLVLTDIIVGLAAFALILTITTWMKARLSTRWLRDTGMDRGAREAVVTLSGYVGFIIAALLGLTLAGVDFKGLAYVLTALSLGIGFGLQNIVSNFVSGLILLFERPIKSGDFVSVGQIEGVIKQIRIRSTEIETLDRQTVIVPNSELVANQVTNWVLHDPYGRLTLFVGVAYGSDTDKVKQVLEEVAIAHPEVLSKGPTPTPKALFNGFGDSSLDFELRVWIRQIEKRFIVTSDLNFAIDKAFREAGIEIPFPQRDLHIKSNATQSPDHALDNEYDPTDPTQDSEKHGNVDNISDNATEPATDSNHLQTKGQNNATQ